jgi:hypothetical protein
MKTRIRTQRGSEHLFAGRIAEPEASSLGSPDIDPKGGPMRRLLFLSLLLAPLPLTPLFAAGPPPSGEAIFQNSRALAGLLDVHADAAGGRILLTLPPPAADGVSGRFLYASSLRTGLGSAPTFLDRGKTGSTQILAFRRIGK